MAFLPSKPLFGDVTVRDPTAPSIVAKGVRAGAAIKQAAALKINKYKEFVEDHASDFVPLAMETFGRMHPAYRNFLKKLTVAAVTNCRIPDTKSARTKYYTRLVQETSVCLQRGNAHTLLVAAALYRKRAAKTARHRRGNCEVDHAPC